MNQATITREEAKTVIWRAHEMLRGRKAIEDYSNAALEVLLWAALFPTTREGVVGYFDAMQSITGEGSWERVQAEIDKECGRLEAEETSPNSVTPAEIEQLRSALLPLARLVTSGAQEDRTIITEALLQFKEESIGRKGFLDCSYSLGQFWKEVFQDKKSEDIACLFPMGVGASIYLAENHQVQTHTANPCQGRWLKGAIKLLSKEIKSLNPKGGWSTSIACPPWREASNETINQDPWLAGAELQYPDSIKDAETRKIYSAHMLCTDKTYALASPAIGFSRSKDIEFFRQELIRKNWLDAVLELPSGVHQATNLGGLLLVLSHNRRENDKVAIISGEKLITNGRSKGVIEWNQEAIEELASLLKEPVESKICKLVTTSDIEDSGYKLQANRYLKSDGDTAIETYLDKRDTLNLGDIAEIKRPLASLGKKSEEGILLREATINDISDFGLIRQGSKAIQIPEAVIAKGRDQLLNEGDVLLSIKGSIGKAAVVGKLEAQTVPGQAFCVIRLRQNAPLSATALVQYLRSEIGQSLFQKGVQGTGVAFLPMGEVKNIPVVIPNEQELERSEQISEVCTVLSEKLSRLTHELKTISNQGWLQDLPKANGTKAR